MKPTRAVVLLKSGRRLDLLDPDPEAWTNQDLAIGLSRTYRWAGYSAWDLSLSVAQHSLTVLLLRKRQGLLTAREALRELLHDATEALIGWDCIATVKSHLGEAFRALDARLQAAVDQRYALPAWSADDYAHHKHADRLAAACEALHVVGWSREDIRTHLALELDPLSEDPLVPPRGMKPWEPWPPRLAEQIFLSCLNQILEQATLEEARTSRSPANIARIFAEARQHAEIEHFLAPNSGGRRPRFEFDIRPARPRSALSAAHPAPSSFEPGSPAENRAATTRAAGETQEANHPDFSGGLFERPPSDELTDEKVEAQIRRIYEQKTANKVPIPKPLEP